MSGPVLVRLTEKQLGELRSVAAAELDSIGTSNRTLEQAVAALDAAQPAMTYAQWSALVGATTDAASLAEDYDGPTLRAWQQREAASSRAVQMLYRLHRFPQRRQS